MSPAAKPGPGERWTICPLDHMHWGANGAGLLLRYAPARRRAALPVGAAVTLGGRTGDLGHSGGAIRDRESLESAVRREMIEEIGRLAPYRIAAVEVQDCGGGWQFQIFLAEVDEKFDAYSVLETDATGWFTRKEARNLPLHSGVRRWLDQAEARE